MIRCASDDYSHFKHLNKGSKGPCPCQWCASQLHRDSGAPTARSWTRTPATEVSEMPDELAQCPGGLSSMLMRLTLSSTNPMPVHQTGPLRLGRTLWRTPRPRASTMPVGCGSPASVAGCAPAIRLYWRCNGPGQVHWSVMLSPPLPRLCSHPCLARQLEREWWGVGPRVRQTPGADAGFVLSCMRCPPQVPTSYLTEWVTQHMEDARTLGVPLVVEEVRDFDRGLDVCPCQPAHVWTGESLMSACTSRTQSFRPHNHTPMSH